MSVCLSVCVCVCVCVSFNNSGTAGPIWPNFFLLAPYWSGDGFRLKNFRIRDPVFPEIRKNLYFRVLFDQFGWNFGIILTLSQICFNTNKFLDRVSGLPDPESGFSGNPKNPDFWVLIICPIWLKFSGNTLLEPNMFQHN